jgi:excinuclease ABC subunit C
VFAHAIPFAAEEAPAALESVPAGAAVFALRFGEGREPYIAQTTDLRRRLRRMLAAEGALSRRVNLLPLVREIAWSPVGSAFEAGVRMYAACLGAYGAAAARKRLRLRPPAYLRFAGGNAYPRLYVTHRLTRRALGETFGPVGSRAAAERAMEAVLDLFQLRRCIEDLEPYPEHPGCLYGEMRRCLTPCKGSCTAERYAEEAVGVFDFLRTRGESLTGRLAAERTAASEALEFEAAAQLHARYERAAAVARELPECMRQVAALRAVMVQASAEAEGVSLFAVSGAGGAPRISGPVEFSTLGMRLPNERSGSSSLFAHPVAVMPVALGVSSAGVALSGAGILEERLESALARLEAAGGAGSLEESADHLALWARWCARPQTQRAGEVLFADAETEEIPRKGLLRAIGRVAAARLQAEPARQG